LLYKFLGAESGPDAVKLLECVCNDHTLRASAPTSFNDPFEFKVSLDFEAEEDVIRHRYFEDNPNTNDADYNKWRAEFTDQSKWWACQQTRAALLSSSGVICFTTMEDNHLLWSHYATQHMGFCVGFDDSITRGLPGVERHGPVAYRREAPGFRFYYDKPEAFAKKAFLFKSDCWAYENEYRVVVDRQGLVKFPGSVLREVILGCRAYPELRRYADQRLDKVEFGFYQMVENFRAYSLTKKRIEGSARYMSSFF
jgi:hypothetical protein